MPEPVITEENTRNGFVIDVQLNGGNDTNMPSREHSSSFSSFFDSLSNETKKCARIITILVASLLFMVGVIIETYFKPS